MEALHSSSPCLSLLGSCDYRCTAMHSCFSLPFVWFCLLKGHITTAHFLWLRETQGTIPGMQNKHSVNLANYYLCWTTEFVYVAKFPDCHACLTSADNIGCVLAQIGRERYYFVTYWMGLVRMSGCWVATSYLWSHFWPTWFQSGSEALFLKHTTAKSSSTP